MADIADRAQVLEEGDRERALRRATGRRQQSDWVPGLAAEATPLPGFDPRIRAELLAKAPTHCKFCEDEIPEARRLAVPGTDTCTDCQADVEGI